MMSIHALDTPCKSLGSYGMGSYSADISWAVTQERLLEYIEHLGQDVQGTPRRGSCKLMCLMQSFP